MKISSEQFEKCQRLSKLEINDSEKEKILEEMSAFLSYADEVVTHGETFKDGRACKNAHELDADIPCKYAFTQKLVSQAPQTKDGFYKVRKTV